MVSWILVLIALVWMIGCAGTDDSASPEIEAAVDNADHTTDVRLDDQPSRVQAVPDRSKAYLIPELVDVEPDGVTVSFAVVTPEAGVTALVATWIQDAASGAPRQQVLHKLSIVAGEEAPTVPMQPICDAVHHSDLVGVELRSVTDQVEVDVEHSRFLNPAADVCPSLSTAAAEQRTTAASEAVPAPSDLADESTAPSDAASAADEAPATELSGTDEAPAPEVWGTDADTGASGFADDVPAPEPSDGDGWTLVGVGPPAGARLDMIGVHQDDFLNVRDMPGGEIVARLREVIWPVDWRFMLYGPEVEPEDIRRDGPFAGLLAEPTETVVVATGNARRPVDSRWHPIWYEIEVGGVTGWASGQHLGMFGQTAQVADQVVSALGGAPTANTLQRLADVVIDALIPEYDPDSWSVILRSGPGVIESSGDVVVDVITVRDGLSVGYQVGIVADNHGDCLTTGDCESRCCDWTSDYGAPFTLRFASIQPICDPSGELTSAGAVACDALL